MSNHKEALDKLFSQHKHEIFYSGYDSTFSIQLHALIKKYGKDVIIDLQYRLRDGRLSGTMACETLTQLGHVEDTELEKYIISFAYIGLWTTDSVDIRDAAGTCLSYLDSPIAIPHLKDAIDRETNDELKEDLEGVLDQLIKTRMDLTKKALHEQS